MTLRRSISWAVVLSCFVVLGACSSKTSPDTKMATDDPVAMNDEAPPLDDLGLGTAGTDSSDGAFATGDGDIPAAPAADAMPGSTASSYPSTPGYGASVADSRGYPDYATPHRGGSGAVSGSSYTIQRGDTLWGLSRRCGVSVSALASANGISPNAILRIGQRLTIPGAGAGSSSAVSGSSETGGRTYRVQRGDTYSGIAHKHGTSSQRLMELNNATSSALREGQTLRIP